MLRDAHEVPHGTTVRADVCVVGAGAAGIALARELAGGPLDVVVLESGGLEEEPAIQQLNEGQSSGIRYFPLEETRYRRLGGSTHRWAGWCRPLDEIDFETRSWVPDSGWPITAAELAPYYVRAAAVCELPRSSFAAADWRDVIPVPYRPPVTGDGVDPVVFQGSPPTKFGDAYRADLERADNVTVFLHATAVELETGDARRVDAVRVGCLDDRRFRVAARDVVLTAGALETARLLLVSRGGHPAGVGNQHDLVGRYFGDHPHVLAGFVELYDRAASGREEIAAFDRGWRGSGARLRLRRPSHGVKFGYAVSGAVQRERELLNHTTHLVPISGIDPSTPWYRSLVLVASNLRSPRRLAAQVRRGAIPEGFGHHLRAIAAHPGQLVRALHREVARRPRVVGLYSQAEQSPCRASRVTLTGRRDALGVPRLDLEWRFAAADRPSLAASLEVIGERLHAAGIGRVVPATWLVEGDGWGEDMTGGHHQLGTARMGADPRRGVVDRDGKVHGVANVFVSDGAAFPTIGYANPLLTIVALALRTADHLLRRAGR